MRKLLCLLVVLAAACDESSTADAGVDSGTPTALLPLCEDTEAAGTDMLDAVPSTLMGTIVPNAARLATPGPDNPASESGELMYRAMGLDRYNRGAGQDHMLRNDLGGTTPPTSGRRSLAWFVQYSDLQLADDESPTRLCGVDNPPIPGGMRAQEAFLPRAVSAMNRTVARIEAPDRPYDFGILTGDCADSTQANEIRWVLEVMNGQSGLHTDSGEDDDPIPGPGNDPKDPFDATPFPAPWLFVPGNHDVLVVGINLPDSGFAAQAIGTTPRTGTRDYRLWYAPSSRRDVPADPERRLVSRQDIVSMLLADTSGPGPVGHGYTASTDLTHGANYVYDAIPDLLRVIVLDTNDDTGGPNGLVHQATIDNFLLPAIQDAEAAGLLIVLSSHHSTRSIDVFDGQLSSTVVPDAVSGPDLEALVAAHPQVIAWVVGHSHDNRVRAVHPDASNPGYWEIMTSALSDWPGQARTIEIVDNGDDTLSIYATLIDFDADDCNERRYRRLMLMEWASAWADAVSSDVADYNVQLLVPLPAGAATRVQDFTGSFDRIESETTLRGL